MTTKGYTKRELEEIELANKLLRFLAKQDPQKKFCSFIEPAICNECRERLEIVKFLLREVK